MLLPWATETQRNDFDLWCPPKVNPQTITFRRLFAPTWTCYHVQINLL